MSDKPRYEQYQGQVFDAVKSKKETVNGQTQMVAVRFNIVDRLSVVEEKNNEPFLSVFAPYSVYGITILEGRESVEANMTLDDFYDIHSKSQMANELVMKKAFGLSDKAPAVQAPVQPASTAMPAGGVSIAFSTALTMGALKGKTPGDIILEAGDKADAIAKVKSHMDFLQVNVGKYPQNQKLIDACKAALDLQERGQLEAQKPEAGTPAATPHPVQTAFEEYTLHEPIDKYYSSKKENLDPSDPNLVFNKCYRYSVKVRPGNNYPYHIEIVNYWAPIGKTAAGLTPINTAKKQKEVKKAFDLTSAQWNSMMMKLFFNTEHAHEYFYSHCRQKDESYSFRVNSGFMS